MRRLILHIGMPKAGSTSVQRFAAGNRARLADLGFHYPDLSHNHSRWLAGLVSPEPVKLDGAVRRRLGSGGRSTGDYERSDLLSVVEAALEPGGAGTTILSGEALFRFEPDRAAALAAFLAPRFDRVRVLCWLREPCSLATSRAQQNVRSGRMDLAALTAPRAIHSGRSRLVADYRRGLETWIRLYGREAVDIREFDRRAFAGGDLLADFRQAAGIPEDPLFVVEDKVWNPSLSAEAVALLDRLVARGLPGRDFERAARLASALPGARFALPAATLDRVRTAAQADVAWLETVTGRRFFAAAGAAALPGDDEPLLWSAETRDALGRLIGRTVADLGGLSAPARAAALGDLAQGLAERATAGRRRRAGARSKSPAPPKAPTLSGRLTALANRLLRRAR